MHSRATPIPEGVVAPPWVKKDEQRMDQAAAGLIRHRGLLLAIGRAGELDAKDLRGPISRPAPYVIGGGKGRIEWARAKSHRNNRKNLPN
jgi:hypothetical protein